MEEFKNGGVTLHHTKEENHVEINYYANCGFYEFSVNLHGYFEDSQKVYDDLKEQIENKLFQFDMYFHNLNQNIKQVPVYQIHFCHMPKEYQDKVNAIISDIPEGTAFYTEKGKEQLKTTQCQMHVNYYRSPDFYFLELDNDYTEQFGKLDELKDHFTPSQIKQFKKTVENTTPDKKLAEKNLKFINECIEHHGLEIVYSLSVQKAPKLFGYDFTYTPRLRGVRISDESRGRKIYTEK